jgi:hypothetical protein
MGNIYANPRAAQLLSGSNGRPTTTEGVKDDIAGLVLISMMFQQR